MTEVTGIKETSRNLSEAILQIEGRSRSGLLEAALFILAEAISFAPVQTGNLRNSGFTDITPPGQGTLIVARVGFTAKYAAYVHEMVRRSGIAGPRQDRTTAQIAGPRRKPTRRRGPRGSGPKRSPPWAPGTGPKFLERAIKDNMPEILAIVARRAQIDGGGRAS